jgi:uncharacterized membrane protein
MTQAMPNSQGSWLRSAKWTGAVSSLLLAMNLLATVLLADLPGSAVATSSVAALLFVVCFVGYLTERKWVLTYSLILVLLTYIGAGLYWLQTKQWIGVLPSLLLLVLLFGRGKLESFLKAQQAAANRR